MARSSLARCRSVRIRASDAGVTSAIAGGRGPPAWQYTRFLPYLEAMPHFSCIAWTTSRTTCARSREVKTYRSGHRARRRSEEWSVDGAWRKAACRPSAKSAAASGLARTPLRLGRDHGSSHPVPPRVRAWKIFFRSWIPRFGRCGCRKEGFMRPVCTRVVVVP